MIETLTALPAFSASRAFFVLQGVGAASTNGTSRLGDPAASVSPCEDDMAWQYDVHGGSASAFPSPEGKWEDELQKLNRLKQGWNGYDAPKPIGAAIETVRSYLQVAKGEDFEPNRLEPSVMGGVGLTHRHGTRKVYVEFYNNGTVHSLFSERAGKMQTMPVGATAEDFRRFVTRAKEYLYGRDPS